MKLTTDQKHFRKVIKASVEKHGGFIGSFGRVTIAIEPTCRDKANISWAICSRGEEFKRKYGEYVALNRLAFGHCLPIEINNGWTLADIAEVFAEAVPMP